MGPWNPVRKDFTAHPWIDFLLSGYSVDNECQLVYNVAISFTMMFYVGFSFFHVSFFFFGKSSYYSMLLVPDISDSTPCNFCIFGGGGIFCFLNCYWNRGDFKQWMKLNTAKKKKKYSMIFVIKIVLKWSKIENKPIFNIIIYGLRLYTAQLYVLKGDNY